jgi:hypothetical protein
VRHASLHKLLLGHASQDDLDNVLSFCDALCPDSKEDVQMVFQGQQRLKDLQGCWFSVFFMDNKHK